MLSLVQQAFVGRDEKRAPLKTPAWEARTGGGGCIVEMTSQLKIMLIVSCFIRLTCLVLLLTVEVTKQPWLKNMQSAAH